MRTICKILAILITIIFTLMFLVIYGVGHVFETVANSHHINDF